MFKLFKKSDIYQKNDSTYKMLLIKLSFDIKLNEIFFYTNQ